MKDKEETFHQRVMSKAYDQFEDGMRYEEFIDSLDPLHRNAVLLGNMNYQVENGGWTQWVTNGYSSEKDRLMNLLKEIHESLDTDETKNMVRLFTHVYDVLKASGNKDEYDHLIIELDSSSDEYYKFNDELLKQFNTFLKSMA